MEYSVPAGVEPPLELIDGCGLHDDVRKAIPITDDSWGESVLPTIKPRDGLPKS